MRHLLAATLTFVCTVSLAPLTAAQDSHIWIFGGAPPKAAAVPQKGRGAQTHPAPKDSGPTLEFTMKYIEDRLNDVNFSFMSRGDIFATDSISGARADVKECSLMWHSKSNSTGAGFSTDYYRDWRLSFRDAIDATVQPGPSVKTRRVEIRMQGKKAHAVKSNSYQPNEAQGRQYDASSAVILFPDEDSAHRMANAMNHAIELCGGGDNDPFRPGGSGSKPTASPSSQSQTPGSFPQSNNSSQASAPVTSTAPAAQSIPFSQPANQTAQEGAQPNWCASSAQVSYVGDSLDANEDIQLWFSLSEGHTDRFRGISVYYTVRYSCYQRGPYTKEDQAVEHLDRGEDHKSLKELFIAHECPLPDHGYPHVERVEITRINCN